MKTTVLVFSATALISLVSFEGYKAKAYADPALGWKVPTVGFGSTGPDITRTTVLQPVEALNRVLKDIQVFENGVTKCVKTPITQGQYDSYVHFSYNVGTSAFCNSTLVKLQNNQQDYPACNQILRWRFAGKYDCSLPENNVCSGLWNRRQFEHKLCIRDL